MTLPTDYALLSLRAYFKDDEKERGPIPVGWEILIEQIDNTVGFSAGAYRNTATGEIVISYAGTNEGIDWVSNFLAAGGVVPAPQVFAAINFYSDIQSQYGSNISFTGHSLGGGLASIMAVFFNQHAEVFNAGPFQLSATTSTTVEAYYAAYLTYQAVYDRPVDAAFYTYAAAFATTFALREENVVCLSMLGEPLAVMRADLTSISGTEVPPYSVGQNDLSGTALHSMNLLTAVMLSPSFRNTLENVPYAVDLIKDESLYGSPTQSGEVKAEFLTYLIRNQIGVQGTGNPDGNGALDKFAADLTKLSSVYGTAGVRNIRDALIVAAMEYSYFKDPVSVDNLFAISDGAVHFKYSDIGATEYKSLPMLADAVAALGDAADPLLVAQLQAKNAWHIQTGTGSMTWSADPNDPQNDVAVGGVKSDSLSGGAGDDILIGFAGNDGLEGGAGDDLLYGGLENDFLFGGAGNDTYVFKTGDGNDTIKGDDNDGKIILNGIELTGANSKSTPDKSGRPTWSWTQGGQTFHAMLMDGDTTNGGTLWVGSGSGPAFGTDRIIIENFKTGDLGLALTSTQRTALLPDTHLNPFLDPDYVVSTLSTELKEGLSRTITLALDQVAIAGQVVRFTASALSQLLKLVKGDDTLSFNSDGTVDVTLAAGQTSLTFALLSQGDIDTDTNLTLDAALLDAQGQAVGIASSLNIAFDAKNEASAVIPTAFDTYVVGTAGNDGAGLSGVNGDNNSGFEAGDSVKFETGDGDDNIFWNGGEPAVASYVVVDAGNGNDMLEGSAGQLWMDGGAGNDFVLQKWSYGSTTTLIGGAGSDFVRSGGADPGVAISSLLFGDQQMSVEAAIALGNTEQNDAAIGDVLSSPVNSSDDLLVGSNTRDVLAGGGGKDQLIGGAGDDMIFGDRWIDFETAPYGPIWSTFRWDFTTGYTIDSNGTVKVGDAVSTYLEYSDLMPTDPLPVGIDSFATNGHAYSTHNLPAYSSRFGDTTTYGAADTIYAGNGNDNVIAGEGDDFIDAGAGNDVVLGDEGNDTILGQAGDDWLQGDALNEAGGQDFIDGGDGNDQIWGGGANDVLYGGAGDDTLRGSGDHDEIGDGDDYLNGEDGDDTLLGNAGADTLIGGVGADLLYGDSTITADARQGDDYLDGGAGNDLLVGWGGADTLIGGIGDDTLDGDGATVSAAKQGNDYLDGGDGNDTLSGAGGADTLLGGAGNDGLYGDAGETPGAIQGDDYLDGGAGNDLLAGWGGADTLIGGDGDDTLDGDGATVSDEKQGDDYLDGGAGNDMLAGGGGADTLMGGDGDDLLDGDGASVSDAKQGDDTLDGGVGKDVLNGRGGNDTLIGGAGDDTLYGGAGDDTLMGGEGLDYLQGDAGNDTYVFDAQDIIRINNVVDGVFDYEGNNNILINGGLDSASVVVNLQADGSISLGNADHSLGLLVNGTSTDITLADGVTLSINQLVGQYYSGNADQTSTTDNATLLGGTRNDALTANGINASVSGGRGSDTLTGGSGSTTYMFELGDGLDTIIDDSTYEASAGTNINLLKFGEGIDLASLSLALDPATGVFTLKVGSNGDGLRLSDFSSTDVLHTRTLDRIQFADGTSIAWADLVADKGIDIVNSANLGVVFGTNVSDRFIGSANDELIDAGAGDDVIESSAGNDTLSGGAGNDVYKFARGGGSDTIVNDDGVVDPGEVDALQLDTSILTTDVEFVRSGNNLLVAIKNSQDVVTVRDYFTTGSIAAIRFADGTSYTAANLPLVVSNLIATANADVLIGTAGNDTIDGLGGNDEIHAGFGDDTINGGTGNDVLEGGAGNDVLSGDSGSDTYRFGRGSGNDTITNYDTSVRNDILEFGEGITPNDLLFSRGTQDDANALVIQIRDTQEQVVVHYYFYSDTAGGYALDGIRFNDGTVWNRKTLNDLFLPVGTAGSDTLTALATDATLHGLGGNDSVNGGNGNDQLFGDAGNDTLHGNAGNDAVYGGSGGDTLYGDAGDDVLDGGAGVDVLRGVDGNDTYLFGHGRGSDTVIETSGTDRILLDAGVLPSDVQLYRDSQTTAGDLILVLDGGASQLRVSSYFSTTSGPQIESIEFADGTIWNSTSIAARVTDISGTANTQTGTAGDDTFQVNHVSDVINEAANAGTDTVLSTVSYILPTNVENLTLQGFFSVNATGNALDNILVGNAGDNSLSGGAGIDTLIGGAGDDTYTVDDSGISQFALDIVQENQNQGYDTVKVLAYSITLADNVEQLIAQQYTGNTLYSDPANDNRRKFIGNGLGNVIDASALTTNGYGLYGSYIDGGAGADLMFGGSVNDTYVVDNVGDVVNESGVFTTGGQSSKADAVEAGVSYVLPDNVEILRLFGNSSITGTGNELNNDIDGSTNLGANVLSGALGDDIYRVGEGDAVVEAADQGVDTVVVSAGQVGAYTLDTFANIENLTLGNAMGSSSAAGNSANNKIWGNASSNVLDGGAGDDNIADDMSSTGTSNDADTLRGGDGNDTLVSRGGADLLDGGAGDDLLLQNTGTSFRTYVFGQNYGHDTIEVSAGSAVVSLLQGVAPSAVTVSRNGADILLTIAGDTGSLLVRNFFVDATSYQPTNVLVQLNFADGTTWQQQKMVNLVRATYWTGPTVGDDVFVGSSNADVMDMLAGNDVVYAGSGNDSIVGGDGNDELWGEQGNDTLTGGAGNDLLHGGAGADSYVFGVGFGQDVIQDSDTVTSEDTAIDEIVFEAGINPADIQITASGAPDLIIKNIVTGDQISVLNFFNVEVGYSGGDHIERIRFADGTSWDLAQIRQKASEMYGTSGDDMLSSIGSLSMSLYGLGGNDQLYGGSEGDILDGGIGNDYMVGGAGDDTYFVDSTSDSVIENTGEGTDTVNSTVSYSLGSDVENLVLLGTSNVNGTGNTLANVITGNSNNNVLSGGSGADTLMGGLGNDTYVVDNAGDLVTENVGEGTDLIQSSITYVLGNNIENLTLTGTTAINGTGNALANTLTGNSGNNVLDGGFGIDTMVGGAGNDTYIVDSTTDVITEAGSAGTDLVQSSASYTLSSNVENLTLTGSVVINGTGNSLVNIITGNAANNVLDGGTGADTLVGGLGDDTYVVDNTSDVVTENANEGIDLVQSSIAHTLGNNVENLTLTGTTAINGTGNTLANVITGNSANNTLSGGAGADTLLGGAGNDTYVVDDVGDVVTESTSEGTDLVQSSVTYTLAANVENLTLTGTAAINATGNTLANTLTGNSGNNVLDGGAGADSMVGGTGNDTYIVDNTTDVVTEAASAGTDLVQSSVSYTLATNVENLTLTGTTVINGTGNILANILTGNSANNTLDGGTGIDTLIGGAGNDIYVVDNTGDVVTENASEGTDLVQSSVTYTLSTNVENLTLTATTAINATGNALDNILLGGSGANTLTGGAGNDTLDGGTGTDTLVGGTGNDVYFVDVTTDVTTENLNEGIDTVNSGVTLTLAANIEALFLTGTTAINGTGNALANLLRGNSGVNTLTGGGGMDILEGGAGNDILSNTSGNTLLNGGAGTDTLTGTANNDLLIGGTGNDALTTGQGADLIAFNKGDGQDTVAVSTTKDNTLSIGGGTVYADLLFQKSGNNLILKVGATDQITFTNYYASTSNRSVNKLQVVLEGSTDYVPGGGDTLRDNKIETFDFGGLVAAFDAALVANPSLTSWALSNALLAQYLTGSDTAALGGDLAYQYGRYGNEANVSYTPAIGILGSASFGTAAQTLQSLASLQDGTPRLS